MILSPLIVNDKVYRRADFGPRELVVMTKAASPQSRAFEGLGGDIYTEYGRSGLRHWGGFVFEEWLQQIQYGRQAAEVYREMSDQDAVIGAILYVIQMMIRRVEWWIEPHDSRASKWAQSVLDDMTTSWTDTLTEIISFLTYGYSYHELVFKLREGPKWGDTISTSREKDGKIGIAKMPLRSQDSMWKWVFKEDGDEIAGMIQNPPPDYLLRFIPIEKCLHFRTTTFKGNPEGRSILRSAYRSWWFVRNIQQLEAIGIERDLAGLPVLIPPEGTDIWDTSDTAMVQMLQMAKNVVSSIRRDEQEGIVLPFGWELKLLASEGQRQFDTNKVISRYETRIATSVIGDLVLMGSDSSGASYALSVTKKDILQMSMNAYLDIVASQFNSRLWPLLWQLNGFKDDCPKLCHGSVELVDIDSLGNFINKIGMTGAPIDWSTTLPWMNKQVGIPQPKPGHDFSPRMMARSNGTDQTSATANRKTAGTRNGAASRVSKMDDFEQWRDHAWEGA